MNLQNILNDIEAADPEVYERTSMRRDIIKNWGRKAALTALPFAFGSLFKTAYGKTTDTITDVLNFALTLEYLEAEFYTTAIGTASLIPAGLDRTALQKITQDENAHVEFLRTAISAAGGTPIDKPTFDFTGNNTFPDVFSNYNTFLAVAQAFEDTGVRAYKGQAPNLMSAPDVLTAALRIHSVEARHAAEIRLLRGINPYIELNESEIPSPAVNGVYAGEENTVQAGVEIVGINQYATDKRKASQYFDEPLTKEQVLTIVTPFL